MFGFCGKGPISEQRFFTQLKQEKTNLFSITHKSTVLLVVNSKFSTIFVDLTLLTENNQISVNPSA